MGFISNQFYRNLFISWFISIPFGASCLSFSIGFMTIYPALIFMLGIFTISLTKIKFDWKKISESKIEKPFFLSGGFIPEDGKGIKNFKHPDFLGIDLDGENPELAGIENIPKLLAFIQSLKNKR